MDKSHPEQGMIASLTCLRLLGERFPKNLSVHFGRIDFEWLKMKFEDWYDKVGASLPEQQRTSILEEAKKEFALFEEQILKK